MSTRALSGETKAATVSLSSGARLTRRSPSTPPSTHSEPGDVFDAVAVGVLGLDRSARCVFANRCALTLLGAAEFDDLRGRSISSIASGLLFSRTDGTGKTKALTVADAAEGLCAGNVDAERVQRVDGTSFWARCRVRPWQSAGRVIGTLLTFEDISEELRAEEERRFQDALLHAQGDASLDGILVVSADSKFVSFNRRFVQMWGVPEDIVGSRDDSAALAWVIGKLRDPKAFLRRVHHLYAHPYEESRDEIALVDGRTFDRFSAPVLAADHRHLGRVWFFRDVTERKRVEEDRESLLAELEGKRRLLEEVLRQLPAGVVAIDAQHGETLVANDQVASLLGLRGMAPARAFEEMRQFCLRADGTPYPTGENPLARAISTGATIVEEEILYPRASGALSTLRVSAAPVRDRGGRVVAGVLAFVDVTERKHQEAERADLLQRERDARREAEAANRSKDEFLATLSHELRTPLNAVLGWTRLLKLGRREEDRERALETIERNALLQAKLIEDLLEVSRIIWGKIELSRERVDLADIVEASLAAVRPAAEGKQIRLKATGDSAVPAVVGDPERLHQVMWNLLTNAIKFTPPGGDVEVTLRAVADSVEVGVSDNGKGIRPEFLPHVFDRFKQADSSSTRDYGGLGLGLAIVRHIVELHEGSIRAESEGEGRGARFLLRFPVSAVTTPIDPKPHRRLAQESRSSGRIARLEGVSVLVVDNEVDAREIVAAILEQYGAEVDVAGSASEAMTALERTTPDVLVSDISMPGEDGYSLITRVRTAHGGRWQDLPAIALTAYARSEDRLRALAAGYQLHLAKPVEPDELTDIIAGLAESNRSKAPAS